MRKEPQLYVNFVLINQGGVPSQSLWGEKVVSKVTSGNNWQSSYEEKDRKT